MFVRTCVERCGEVVNVDDCGLDVRPSGAAANYVVVFDMRRVSDVGTAFICSGVSCAGPGVFAGG